MAIYVNQVGYLPSASKIAVCTFPCNFQVIDAESQHSVLDGVSQEAGFDACSKEQVWQIDFSGLNRPGSYYILAGNGEKSCRFAIGEQIYHSLKKDLIKALYFQRCGCSLDEAHAGLYTHPACHTAPAVFLEDYLQNTADPQTFDMTGGWHDAGDFGRYTSAGAVALAHLLYAYELFPESLQDELNLPESGNGIPDLLNECLYELNWMLKMQAPEGGAYHKLTAFRHADFIMPQEDKDPFLIYPVSSVSTGDFAAVMALASRIYAPFLPEFSARALTAAKRAWSWLTQNPYISFRNPEGSNTGEYGDDCDLDERLWACAELLRTDTGNSSCYLKALKEYADKNVSKTDFGWTDVSGLASLSILTDSEHHADAQTSALFRSAVLTEAERLLAVQRSSGYRLAMKPEDFVWGSNMVVCNRSMLLILASLITNGDSSSAYRSGAMEQLHYLLGRNALDTSYVTGYGEHAFRNPHNRSTFADGIEPPMPGWVSGGPFKTPCDEIAVKMIPKGTAPMKCYIDHVDSYSTNEITIYWNSPAVFMTAFLEQENHTKKYAALPLIFSFTAFLLIFYVC